MLVSLKVSLYYEYTSTFRSRAPSTWALSPTSMRIIWLPTGGHVGDAVMVTSLFAEALERQSNLHIQYVVRRNARLIAELASAYPQIEIVAVPRNFIGMLAAVAPLFRYSAIVVAPPAWDVHPFIIKLLAILFRVRGDIVIGYDDKTRFQPWSRTISYKKHTQLYIDGLRNAFKAVGIPTASEGSAPQLQLHTRLPEDFPFTDKPYVVIHPFPHMATFKTIPLRRWKDLITWLKQTYPSYGIVLTGGEVDREQAIEVGGDVYLSIAEPLLVAAGLMERARLYIGVDTGPTHIAGVLGAPSVVLAHLNEPTWLPSYNPNAILLSNKKECVCAVPGEECTVTEDGKVYRRCVYYIEDETIHAAIRQVLDGRS